MRLIRNYILAVLISFAVIVAVAASPIVGMWFASLFYRLLFEGKE